MPNSAREFALPGDDNDHSDPAPLPIGQGHDFMGISGLWKQVAGFGVIGVVAAILFWWAIWIQPAQIKDERQIHREDIKATWEHLRTLQQEHAAQVREQMRHDEKQTDRVVEAINEMRLEIRTTIGPAVQKKID